MLQGSVSIAERKVRPLLIGPGAVIDVVTAEMPVPPGGFLYRITNAGKISRPASISANQREFFNCRRIPSLLDAGKRIEYNASSGPV